MPSSCRASTACADSGADLVGQLQRARPPRRRRSTCRTIAPSPRHAARLGQLGLAGLVAAAAGRRPAPSWPSTVAVTPTAGDDEKSDAAGTVSSRAARGGDDGPGQRVLGVGLGGGRQRQHVVFACGRRVAATAVTRGLALGQGAGLVEQHGADRPHALQREPVLDQHAAAGGAFGGDGHHQRDRQAERVRAGDDQHGDGADDGLVGLPERAPTPPR